MFPIILDVVPIPLMIVGQGESALKRLLQLDEAQARQVVVFAPTPIDALVQAAGPRLVRAWPGRADIQAVYAVFVANVSPELARSLYTIAHELQVLIHVEDVIGQCDFHVPAQVRRGDLLLTISTNGRSPALSRRLRQYLQKLFGPEWARYTAEIAARRVALKKTGHSMAEVFEDCVDYVRQKGLLRLPKPRLSVLPKEEVDS